MKEFWNERYGAHESVYGREPNIFFRAELDKMKPGLLLLPAEGEGRNAVYAATRGWTVSAFDYSEVAKEKALACARDKNVTIDYIIADLETYSFRKQFDLIALIYVHMPESIRGDFFNRCYEALLPGGRLIMEVFSKDQLQYNSGGPRDLSLLYDEHVLPDAFPAGTVITCTKEIITLEEGAFHAGPASVVRMILQKPA